jgi:7-carboxy-7-deazaguanine synthase
VTGELVVSEVFGPTFQGEGPSTGRRAGFVRLGRCNLTCTWCDTPYTWDWERHDPAVELRRAAVAEVLHQLEAMAVDLVVVTGGEPLLQQRRLTPLLTACRERGWEVEVETNATLVPLPEVVPLVSRFNASPKLANSGVDEHLRLVPEALVALRDTGRAVFKFVAATEDDLDEIGEIAGRFDLAPVWVMPEGTTAAAVLDGARRLAGPVLERGWHLGTRLHVLLWEDERGR